MSPDPSESEGRQVPIVWVGAEDVPVVYANAFVAQVNQQEFFLTVGQIVPPPILAGSPEEIQQQVNQIQFVQARAVARVALTEPRLRELIGALQTTLDNYEKMPPEAKGMQNQ